MQKGPTQALWDLAETFFEQNPDESRIKMVLKGVKMSFIKAGEKIFSVGNFLGFGLTSKVKELQDRGGDVFVEKVTRGFFKDVFADDNEDGLPVFEHEKEVLDALGLLVGYFEYTLPEPKQLISDIHRHECIDMIDEYFKIKTKQRQVFVMPKFEGQMLCDVLGDEGGIYDHLMDKIALECAKQLQIVHNKRHAGKKIVYGDIGNSQFLVKIEGENVSVKLVDFGNSILMPKDDAFIKAQPRGNVAYASEELKAGIYSQGSDCYAFGELLSEFPQMDYDDDFADLVERLCAEDVSVRANMDEVVSFFDKRCQASLDGIDSKMSKLNII